MLSTGSGTDPSGLQLTSAGVCLAHGPVIVAGCPLYGAMSSQRMSRTVTYFWGLIGRLQVCLIVWPRDHIAEAIH